MDDELQHIREKKMNEMMNRIQSGSSPEGALIHINQENYHDIIRNNENLIIDFWAPWCGPCRMLGPVFEELAGVYAGRIRFAKCNTDENQVLASQFGISAIPTLFFYHKGQVVHQVAGVMPRPQLEAQIKMVYQIP